MRQHGDYTHDSTRVSIEVAHDHTDDTVTITRTEGADTHILVLSEAEFAFVRES